jgi:hypothetical protein
MRADRAVYSMLHAKLEAARRGDSSSPAFTALGGWLTRLPACAARPHARGSSQAVAGGGGSGAAAGVVNVVVLDASRFLHTGIVATLAAACVVDSSTIWLMPAPNASSGPGSPGSLAQLERLFQLTTLDEASVAGEEAWVSFRLRIPCGFGLK